jgi:beta-1,4-N-acetylglucosaminyltransferase
VLVASSGGHLLELVALVDRWPSVDRHWVTFDRPDSRSLLLNERVTYAYHPTNRSLRNLIRNSLLAARLLAKLRPEAIVTTGAGVAVPFCYIGRLMGARVVYIESLARVSQPSLTGRLVHPIVHAFYVQWPQLEHSLRKAEYHGPIFS